MCVGVVFVEVFINVCRCVRWSVSEFVAACVQVCNCVRECLEVFVFVYVCVCVFWGSSGKIRPHRSNKNERNVSSFTEA